MIPPRKREEEAPSASKAKKVEKEKVPLVPPPSPFQLPGTTRTTDVKTLWKGPVFGVTSFVHEVVTCFGVSNE